MCAAAGGFCTAWDATSQQYLARGAPWRGGREVRRVSGPEGSATKCRGLPQIKQITTKGQSAFFSKKAARGAHASACTCASACAARGAHRRRRGAVRGQAVGAFGGAVFLGSCTRQAAASHRVTSRDERELGREQRQPAASADAIVAAPGCPEAKLGVPAVMAFVCIVLAHCRFGARLRARLPSGRWRGASTSSSCSAPTLPHNRRRKRLLIGRTARSRQHCAFCALACPTTTFPPCIAIEKCETLDVWARASSTTS